MSETESIRCIYYIHIYVYRMYSVTTLAKPHYNHICVDCNLQTAG